MHGRAAIFPSWWCLVRSPFLIFPFPCSISFAFSSHRLQIFRENTQKLRTFGLKSVPLFRTEVGLRACSQPPGGGATIPSCHSDQLLSFLNEKEPGKSSNCCLEQAAYYLLLLTRSIGLAHVCELQSGGLQSWGLDPTTCCQTHLAGYGFRILTSKAQKANWMQS